MREESARAQQHPERAHVCTASQPVVSYLCSRDVIVRFLSDVYGQARTCVFFKCGLVDPIGERWRLKRQSRCCSLLSSRDERIPQMLPGTVKRSLLETSSSPQRGIGMRRGKIWVPFRPN
ncbi:uncharacterized protein V6R79_020249 [Siganus canaliculatus]